MATAPTSLEDMVKKVNENADYKVLTKEEYESLLNIASHRTSTPHPTKDDSVTRPKVSMPQTTEVQQQNFTFASPALASVPRLKFLSQSQSSKQLNASFQALPYSYPKLPFFSGSEEPQKNETTYEVWSFEVKCLQKVEDLQEHVLLQSIRNSLKGTARAMLVPLGEHASVQDILNKLDGFYGNVSTSETLIQSFYNDFQKDTESIVSYSSRIEQTLSRAIRCGHADFAAKDAMLRSKFWTGLKSQQLKNSTRHLYDSVKDFQTLLREIRKVEQEEVSSSRPVTKTKVAQQQSEQASAADGTSQLLKQMTELMSRMKTLEDKLEAQTKSVQASNNQASNNQPSYNQYDYNPQYTRGRGKGYRGSWRGNSGGGYQNRGNYNQNKGNFNNNYRGGNRGGYSRSGNRGGANGRDTDRGTNSKQSNDKQSLNL